MCKVIFESSITVLYYRPGGNSAVCEMHQASMRAHEKPSAFSQQAAADRTNLVIKQKTTNKIVSKPLQRILVEPYQPTIINHLSKSASIEHHYSASSNARDDISSLGIWISTGLHS